MFRRPEHARYRDAFPALARRAWALRTPARALDARSKSSSDLTRCLGAFDLLMLGVGGVIGGGVFVLTGAAAHDHAGPAVVVSYVLASLTSMVTALCYVEFAVECPVAGSAYNFVAQAFGEFAGYVAGCNLGLELTISAAAVARGWTSYVCTLFRADPDALRVRLGGILLDVPAALLVAAVTVMLARGMRNTARFNAAVTVVSLLVIGFVIVFGFAEVEPRNWSPFAPNGLPGVFSGAGVVFFSFVGFDTVATCAEETKNPGRDLPVGIMGSLGICAGLYALMSLVITGMVPTPEIDVQAPFAAAFRDKGLGWAESVISLGAVAAITTALLSSLMGQPRVYMVMARDGLLPAWIARVHERFGTPLNASAFTGVTTGALALLVDIETLAQLVSIGTLFVFGSVCAGLLARRHTPEDGSGRAPALWRLAALLVSCVGVSASYRAMTLERGTRGEGAGAGGGGEGDEGAFSEDSEHGSEASSHAAASACLALAFVGVFASTASFLSLPRHNAPKRGFETPFVPYLPALGVLATTHLVASLPPAAWIRFLAYFVFTSALYVAYGVAGIAGGWGPTEARSEAYGGGEGAELKELERSGLLGEDEWGVVEESEGDAAAEALRKECLATISAVHGNGGGTLSS